MGWKNGPTRSQSECSLQWRSKFTETIDAVTSDNFKNSRWANYFTVDSSNIVRNGHANPNHVFETFGSFSGHTGTEVQVKLLENIAANMSFYERRSAVCLQMRSMNLETWVETIANELVYCDELGLMGLCYMYQRHCVVLTQNKLWSTVQADKPLNLLDLLNICSIRLIYLGNLHFGVLTWRPHLPKKVATKSPGFNIIEEYTLDEANVTADATKDKGNSVNQNLHPGNVETPSLDCEPTTSSGVKVETAMLSKTDATNLPKADTHYTPTGDDRTSSPLQCVETGSGTKSQMCAQSASIEKKNIELESSTTQSHSTLPVETRSEKPTSGLDPEHPDVITNASQNNTKIKDQVSAKWSVTCPEDSLLLLQYPWKCELNVKLDRIQPLEIDIWSNKVSDYHVLTKSKEVTPIISEVKGYGLCARPIKTEPPVDDLNEDKTD